MLISDIFKNTSLPYLETEILISFLNNKSREYILAHLNEPLSQKLAKKFKILEKKRLSGWPIAYLIGHKGFYGLNFAVSPATLVPRPESELIVDEIITIVKNDLNNYSQFPKTAILDVGTGSGALIISIAKELQKINYSCYKKIDFSATDISNTALKIAKQNSKTHRLDKKIKFYHGDILSPLINRLKNEHLIIAANLPYLTKEQIKKSPSIQKEPKLALDGGRDGLFYYRKLFLQLFKLKPKPLSITILCEIDPGQAIKIKNLIKKSFSETKIKIKKDLAGKKRLLIADLK